MLKHYCSTHNNSKLPRQPSITSTHMSDGDARELCGGAAQKRDRDRDRDNNTRGYYILDSLPHMAVEEPARD
jgi:hypothetical protein